MDIISSRIREERRKLDLTQEELAKKINTGKSTVSNWESGYSKPTPDMLLELSKIFNVSIDYLLGNANFRSEKELELASNKRLNIAMKYMEEQKATLDKTQINNSNSPLSLTASEIKKIVKETIDEFEKQKEIEPEETDELLVLMKSKGKLSKQQHNIIVNLMKEFIAESNNFDK